MANIKFNRELAQQWESKAEVLKQRADEILKKVAACLQDMQGASDNITAAIYQVGAELAPKFNELISAVARLIEVFKDVCNKLQELADAAINGIKSAAQNMMGGLTITATSN